MNLAVVWFGGSNLQLFRFGLRDYLFITVARKLHVEAPKKNLGFSAR